MKRRNFLRQLTTAAALSPIAGMPLRAQALLPNTLAGNVIVNFMMLGGPDFRHVFPPAFDPAPGSYGRTFWRERASSYAIEPTPEAAQDYWNTSFHAREFNGINFGILRGMEWLDSMWQSGNVALAHNVVGAVSRNHEHAQILWENADRSVLTSSDQTARPATGWGGRLAQAADTRVISTGGSPRLFCMHSDTLNPELTSTRKIVTLTNPESAGLFEPAMSVPDDDFQRGISRALGHYYQAIDSEHGAPEASAITAESRFRAFVDHQRGLEELGDLVRPRFDSITEPPELTALYSGAAMLGNPGIALQFRSLYYALAAGDILPFSAVSMAYGSFDSHDRQKEEIENKFVDLFSPGGAMDTLYQLLPDAVRNRVVFAFSGEFGRQLKGNGGNGTDHGRGNAVLLVGHPVRGGLYGDPFPASELDVINEPGPDIEGRTDADALFAELSDWAVPGSRATVFPDAGTARIEPGVDLSRLFS